MPEDEKKPTDIQDENKISVIHFSNQSSLGSDESHDSAEQMSENTYREDTRAERTPEVVAAEKPTAHDSTNQPAQVTAIPETKTSNPNTPGVLILQWLTYAFWGWTLIALYWLTGISTQYFVQNANTSDGYGLTYLSNMLAYSLAAVIVLFVISIICDIVYSKFEPRHKSGAAMVIMIIHAVIFALCAIGSLIAAVFAVVNMLISGGGEGATTTLITAGVMTLLYAVTLVRTLHPGKIKRVTQLFWVTMLVATIVIGSLGIFGPVAYTQKTKNDRAIESGLPDVAYAINEYARENSKLPTSLNDSGLSQHYSTYDSEDTDRIIEENMVRYTAKEQMNGVGAATVQPGERNGMSSSDSKLNTLQLDIGRSNDTKPVFHYELCVTYDAKKNGSGYSRGSTNSQKYDTSPETSSHPAGEVCYDLQTDYIYNY